MPPIDQNILRRLLGKGWSSGLLSNILLYNSHSLVYHFLMLPLPRIRMTSPKEQIKSVNSGSGGLGFSLSGRDKTFRYFDKLELA